MSHETELAMVRRLEELRQEAIKSNDPVDWRKYYEAREQADRRLGIQPTDERDRKAS